MIMLNRLYRVAAYFSVLLLSHTLFRFDRNKLRQKKYLIIGHAQHGKDEVASILSLLLGVRYEVPSVIVAREFMFDKLKDKYGYTDPIDCYNRRHECRKEWLDNISSYNENNHTRLLERCFEISNIYTGVRRRRVIDKAINDNIVDYIFYVDAESHKKLESKEQFELDKGYADVIIMNDCKSYYKLAFQVLKTLRARVE